MSLTTFDHYELIQELTSDTPGGAEQRGLRLNDFATDCDGARVISLGSLEQRTFRLATS